MSSAVTIRAALRFRIVASSVALVAVNALGTMPGVSQAALISHTAALSPPAMAANADRARATGEKSSGLSRPVISRVSVTHGSTDGGTQVTLNGTGFSHLKWVNFGASRAHVVGVIGSSKIVVTTPKHRTGLVNIQIATTAGTSPLTNSDHFRFVVIAASTAVQVSVGQASACAVTSAGAVDCWGAPTTGELGNGKPTDFADSLTPRPVVGLSSGVRQVSVGSLSTACAVTKAGIVKCWGSNSQGALGNGGTESFSATPVKVAGLRTVRQVAVGGLFGCALTNTGGVLCWGDNSDGELGNGGNEGESGTPVAVSGLSSGVSAITVAGGLACALTTSGGVLCWGNNVIGQLGDGGVETMSRTPVIVSGLSSGVATISGGGSGVCATTTVGALKCWGEIYDLPDHLLFGSGLWPKATTVFGLASGVSASALGTDSGCLITAGGGVQCWGSDTHGSLGDGKNGNGGLGDDSQNPVPATGLSSAVRQVSVGFFTACAITTTGRLYCWGLNHGGNVGNGSQPDDVVPVPTMIKLR